MHTVHVLTVSAGLPMELLDALLSRAESVLDEHGASRIWIDPSQPGTVVMAEFPAPVTPAAPYLAPEVMAQVVPETAPYVVPETVDAPLVSLQ